MKKFKTITRNPFTKSHAKRGLSDSIVPAGNLHQNSDITMIPGSSSSAAPPAHSPSNSASSNMAPAGYPYNSSYPQNNPPPPIAYPYPAQPDEGVSTGPVWEFNTGENKNMKGQQKGGHVSVGNTVAGTPAGICFSQNGRYVFNTGKNYNEGDVQENGNVEFGNVYKDSH